MTQHETLAAALAAFQAELPKLSKDQSAKVTGESQSGAKISYTYGYADLAQVTETVSPILGKHGLSFTSVPTMTEHGFLLAYSLLHESGEKIDGQWPLPDPTRTKPQQVGSAITYGRRYAFMAVTNTFPGGEDDDGAAAVPTGHRDKAMSPEEFQNLPRERPARPQNAPTSPAAPAPKKVFTDAEVLEQHAKLDTLDLDKAGALYDWMASKGLHDRAVGDDTDIPPASATTRLAVRLASTSLLPETTAENITWLRDFADARGLLKTPVSPKQTLGQILTEEKDARVAKAIAQSGNAQAMRQAAADSWGDDQTEGERQAEQHASVHADAT